jgi:hypothetical protein
VKSLLKGRVVVGRGEQLQLLVLLFHDQGESRVRAPVLSKR